MAEQKLSVRRACAAVALSRAAYYRPAPAPEHRDAAVIEALNSSVAEHATWGFWECFDALRYRGHGWNHKRVWRVYRAMKLNRPRRTRKRVLTRERQMMEVLAVPNVAWALDFMSDALYHGRRFRVLNVLDEGTREALDIVIDTSIP